MTPQAGKYYRVNGLSQFRKVFAVQMGIIVYREIYMSDNRTRIEVYEAPKVKWDAEEITKAQFDRVESLANARIKQYEYYTQI